MNSNGMYSDVSLSNYEKIIIDKFILYYPKKTSYDSIINLIKKSSEDITPHFQFKYLEGYQLAGIIQLEYNKCHSQYCRIKNETKR